jgi:nicotinamide phosphoribosyltransferase
MNLIATLAADGYKLSHRIQYPKGTTNVYSTWIPRSGKHAPEIKNVVCFGIQGALKEVNDLFNKQFFNRSKEEVIIEYKRQVSAYLFNPNVETKHIEDLHDLGFLPIEVKSLKEGTLVPYRVPMMTIENTKPEFFWVTNYLETILSSLLWKPSTTASIAHTYRSILDDYALQTTGSTAGVEFQGHDFSMRGQSGPEDSARSGVGHLLSFVGTDTLPAISYAEQYYGADVTKELVGCSVPASEHSCMCAGGYEDERETYRRFIEDLYPTGIVSIVSDTWDLWNVMTNIIPSLKESILARNGGEGSLDKVVIRPDSGDPVNILCGDPEAKPGSSESKGVIELLYETFGGSVTPQGFKLLNPKVGAIYGDSITITRCKEICERLKQKGFASTNVVLGIGSYTYQYITRDTLGFAMKATSVTINGTEKAIFKAPKTDDGTKNSAKGKVKVFKNDQGILEYSDDTTLTNTKEDLLKPIFINGNFLFNDTLSNIRKTLKEQKISA